MENVQNLSSLCENDRRQLRTDFYLISGSLAKLIKNNAVSDPTFGDAAVKYRTSLDNVTKFIPDWIKVAIACSVGFGTMVGWKCIVVTVGEKIGKSHLGFAQRACAELVAACTIRIADVYGLPVSTTHVLSSGVARTMAANHSGLQKATLRKRPACSGANSARVHVPRRRSVRLWTVYRVSRSRRALKQRTKSSIFVK